MGDSTVLQRLRTQVSRLKPGLVRGVLVLLCLSGVAAQLIEPLGDALNGKTFLGGSFAAFIALVLFDAITSGDRPREISGVIVLDELDDLTSHMREAFRAKHVKIDFQGFTMETLVQEIRPAMLDLARNPRGTKSLALRVILPCLDFPMNLPSELSMEDGHLRFRDSPADRERMRGYSERYRNEFDELVRRVRERHPSVRVDWQVLFGATGPQVKLIVLNDEISFFSFYDLVEGEFKDANGVLHQILDPRAYGMTDGGLRMVGWSRRSRSESSRRIADYYASYFDRLWEIFERIRPPGG
ncbi:MAG: hypothetical protein ACRDP3_24370 [Streptomyces sp.]|uniref:hypothetical protein n=1 Tax=Streptomyces sp. TaxID=1931 RepID=UPI003D6A96DA